MSAPSQPEGNRDKQIFGILVATIFILPLFIVVYHLARGRSSTAEFDAINGIYSLVELLLVISLLVFSIRVWRRSRRIAMAGLAMIGILVLLVLLS